MKGEREIERAHWLLMESCKGKHEWMKNTS